MLEDRIQWEPGLFTKEGLAALVEGLGSATLTMEDLSLSYSMTM